MRCRRSSSACATVPPVHAHHVTSKKLGLSLLSADNKDNPNFFDVTWCAWTGGTVAQALLERLQRMLTTGERDSGCVVGTKHEHAAGYVTLDLVNSCSLDSPLDPEYWTKVILYDNVLTGDYERINPNVTTGNYAGGNPLVHIRAIPAVGTAGSNTTHILPFHFSHHYTPPTTPHLNPLPTQHT